MKPLQREHMVSVQSCMCFGAVETHTPKRHVRDGAGEAARGEASGAGAGIHVKGFGFYSGRAKEGLKAGEGHAQICTSGR